jgi:hypothetical protein
VSLTDVFNDDADEALVAFYPVARIWPGARDFLLLNLGVDEGRLTEALKYGRWSYYRDEFHEAIR